MKRIVITILLSICLLNSAFTQETEQQLENIAERSESEIEDDAMLQDLQQFRKHPVNLNTADANDLKQLRMLSEIQISNLLSYRKLLGKLISIYELQTIPGWNIEVIQQLLPYITVAVPFSMDNEFRNRFKDGDHSLLFRLSQTMEKAKGFADTNSGRYLGSPQHLFFRHKYSYKNLLQFGITGDKDAGEQFFKGDQKKGFDFYSFHLFARKLGIVESIAIGDFTVNMGQGLIHWQTLAFKKGSDAINIKRQSAVLRSYNSAGELYFHRGAGITIKKWKLGSTFFASFRNISANMIADTVSYEDHISSFLTSGYHRDSSEIAHRNKLKQTTFGGNLSYNSNRWQICLNAVHYQFSSPIQKRNEPYNLYAINGKNWWNASMDYSYTYRNFHLFGEAAIDKQLNKALLNGLLLSIDPKVDLSLLHRHIAPGYQSIYGNAFTENTLPSNESGLYAGIVIRPKYGWRIDAFADIYKFPWLKYQVDAPSNGKDFSFQITYVPSKGVELYTRFRGETKQSNQPDNLTTTNFLINRTRKNWRTHITYPINSSVTIRNRIELVWFDKSATGFLTYFDLLYKPMLSKLSGNMRFQYFETSNYDARIYAYENDVLYSYSIPSFYDKGIRYYLNLNYELSKNISCWLRWAQTVYRDKKTIGSGKDEIQGNKKSQLTFQLQWSF